MHVVSYKDTSILAIDETNLIWNIGMVFSGHAFTDGRFHQSWERWQHIDWWINLAIMNLTINVNLAFCDVPEIEINFNINRK